LDPKDRKGHRVKWDHRDPRVRKGTREIPDPLDLLDPKGDRVSRVK
jgi:hypothetical protein